MPEIAERRKVLDGRAEVITYSRDESAWYYREPDGSGGYRQRRLKDALSEVDAVAMAMDVWSEMRTTQQLITSCQVQVKPTRRTKKTSVDTSIDEFLDQRPSILSYRYQNYDTFVQKYRIGIVSVSKFCTWKVSV